MSNLEAVGADAMVRSNGKLTGGSEGGPLLDCDLVRSAQCQELLFDEEQMGSKPAFYELRTCPAR